MSEGNVMLTVFLRHDQSKNLDEINEILFNRDFTEKFPPPGVKIVSWHVLMGIGQVVTLEVPPDLVRTVNRTIEQGAWGAFRTEFYLTYDFLPAWQDKCKAFKKRREELNSRTEIHGA